MAILKKYKDTFDDLINSSNTKCQDLPKSQDWPGLINKGSQNAPMSRDGLPTLLEEDRLDEDVSVMSLELVRKIRASQVHQHHNVALFGLMYRKTQYVNSQRGEEDGKSKRNGENGKGERGEEAIGEIR